MEKSDVANLDDFLDEPMVAEPLEDEGYENEGPGQIQLDKAKLDKDFLIDGRRIKLFGFLRITAGGLGLGAQLTPRG